MFKRALFSLPVLALSAGMAQAVPINLAGSYSLTNTGTTGVVAITNDLANPFSLPLTLGTPDVENFLTLTPDPGNGTNTYNFTILANFTFTAPGNGVDADLGTGTFHVQGHTIDSGSLTWVDGATGSNILLSNGDLLNLNLSDVSFSGDATGGNPQIVTATFTLTAPVGNAASVPEPATLALFGAGLLGLAGLKRRRDKAKT